MVKKVIERFKQYTAQGLKWSDKEWYKTIYYIQNP